MSKSKEFLHSYINAYSPVAEEVEGQRIWVDYVKNYADEVDSDAYGTAWAIRRSDVDNPKKVVIEAHCDEIAWMITYIDNDGHIRVAKHGGSDAAIAPSKKVVIHTRKNGKIPGVFGFPAIHTRKGEEKASKPEDIFIDAGLDSKKDVIAAGIEVGNIVTFVETFEEIGDYYVGKSLDNKIGGYIIAQVLKRIHKEKIKLPYDLYVINSVQEEVGLYGAKLIAKRLQPDFAFVHDVCHHTTTPGLSKIKNCDVKCGLGPTLQLTAQNHRKLVEFVRGVADEKSIPYQVEMGSYGNDTMGFFLENVVTMIISSPLKYMHTTVESVSKKDVKNAIELFYQTLVNFNPDMKIKALN